MKQSTRLLILLALISVVFQFQSAHALGLDFPNPFTDNITGYADTSIAAKIGKPCSVGGATVGALVGVPVGGVIGVIAAPLDFFDKGDISRAIQAPAAGALAAGYGASVLLGISAGKVCGYPFSFFSS